MKFCNYCLKVTCDFNYCNYSLILSMIGSFFKRWHFWSLIWEHTKCCSIFQLHIYFNCSKTIFCRCDNIGRPKSCDMIITMQYYDSYIILHNSSISFHFLLFLHVFSHLILSVLSFSSFIFSFISCLLSSCDFSLLVMSSFSSSRWSNSVSH